MLRLSTVGPVGWLAQSPNKSQTPYMFLERAFRRICGGQKARSWDASARWVGIKTRCPLPCKRPWCALHICYLAEAVQPPRRATEGHALRGFQELFLSAVVQAKGSSRLRRASAAEDLFCLLSVVHMFSQPELLKTCQP